MSATTVHDREGNPIIKYMEDAQMWLELPKICDIGAVVALQQVAVSGHMGDVMLEVMDWLPKNLEEIDVEDRLHQELSLQLELETPR